MTSKAVWLLNSKTLSIISPSASVMAPFSSAMSARMRMSSSVISSVWALGSMRSRRSTPLVDTDSSHTMGRVMVAKPKITPLTARATASVFCMATRLGTSSPKTREK